MELCRPVVVGAYWILLLLVSSLVEPIQERERVVCGAVGLLWWSSRPLLRALVKGSHRGYWLKVGKLENEMDLV